MSADVAVSLAVMASAVVLSDAARRISRHLLPRTSMREYAAEFASAFQLCCCTNELRLLGETGALRGGAALALTYAAAVVHALTFRGATGNPIGVLEHAYRGRTSGARALLGIVCQFLAAAASRPIVQVLWGRGLSGMHARHALKNFQCASAIRATLPEAVCVEMACAFAVQSAHAHTRRIQEKYRVHVVAAVITSVVYAGGSMTGAVYNPALAFSTQFGCIGNSLAEYCMVYWMGPLMGMLASVLIFDPTSSQPSPQHVTKRK
ncbi:aquaporin-11 [Syngnathus acus]|uniref:aquaporin-11 n=1 Tax=Syngnathus acus TaxID=161584 RepID=UPI001885CE72|nr:aquaporin-11 [Syngnathus acus]